VVASIFLDFSLPNAATWFYFSFLLAITVFFKFDRLLALRNWDLVALYLIIPGLLLIQEAHALQGLVSPADREAFQQSALSDDAVVAPEAQSFLRRSHSLLVAGYIWLVIGSGYFFLRAIFDLGLEKRPALLPNVTLPGMVWLGAALFLCVSVVAVRWMPDSPQQVGRGPVALTKVQDGATAVVGIQSGIADWDQATTTFWVERVTAIGLHLSVVIALVLIGSSIFRDPVTGVGMAVLYLMLPVTSYHVSQVHHVWPVAFILWAIYCFRRPARAGACLGVAAGSAFFPFLLFPLWFGFYRGRGATRFAVGFLVAAGVSLGLTALLLLLNGELRQDLNLTLGRPDWQAWKAPRTEGLWQGSHWAYRLPVFIAYVAVIVLTMFWPTPRNLAQVIAQSAAVVIGVQFWYADQGGVYILWYLPLLLLMMFRPNLVEVRPPAIQAPGDWVFARIRRAAGRWWARDVQPGPTRA
jgi:hypothetical protein